MYYHPKPAASHAAALRPGQLRHVIRVASIIGRQPIRDVMLLWLTHPKTIAAIEAWLAYRRARGWGLSSDPEFRGFRPDERLVLTHKGRAFELARKVRQLNTGPVEYRCCDALQQLMSRLYRQAGIKGGSSHSGRRTLAAKVLAKTGQVELVQLLLGHAEPDHVWPYLDVDKQTIRHAFELAL